MIIGSRYCPSHDHGTAQRARCGSLAPRMYSYIRASGVFSGNTRPPMTHEQRGLGGVHVLLCVLHKHLSLRALLQDTLPRRPTPDRERMLAWLTHVRIPSSASKAYVESS